MMNCKIDLTSILSIKPNLKTIPSLLFISLFLIEIVGCSPSNDANKKNDEDVNRFSIVAEEKKRQENRERVVRILNYMPSPLETADLIEKASLNFDEALLHDRDKSSDYLVGTSRALNLGIYGADLSYIKLHEKNNFASSYLVPIRQLSEELGIPEQFTEETYKKINSDYESRREDLEELAKAYEATEEYLRSNDRSLTSALLVTGGWIEGMYIACESLNEKSNPILLRRIAEQKYTLEQIILMLESVDQNKTIDILSNLKLLRVKFKMVNFDYVKDNLLIDSVKHKAFWKNSNWQLTDKEFSEIRQTVNNLRDKAIK